MSGRILFPHVYYEICASFTGVVFCSYPDCQLDFIMVDIRMCFNAFGEIKKGNKGYP